MLDDVDPELHRAPDRRVEGRVRRDGTLVLMRLVDDRFELGVGELDVVMARHDLDEVGSPHDLLAHRAPHLVGPRRLPAAPVGVSAGLSDGFAADEEPRPRKDALLDRLLREESRLVHAQIADGRRAGLQRVQHVRGALVRAHLGRVMEGLVGEIVDAVPAQVRVGVDDARKNRPLRLDDLVPVGSLTHPRGYVGAHVHDRPVLDLDVAAVVDLFPDARDHPPDEEPVERLLDREVLGQFLELPCWGFGHRSGSPYFSPSCSRALAAPSRLRSCMLA